MSEDSGPSPGAATPGSGGQQTGDTWDDLGRQLNELGAAMSQAVRAAVDDPENRRRAAGLRDDLDALARRVGAALDEATNTPQGQRVKEEVGKAADSVAAAGRKVADEVRPHLIDAARSASEKLREAAAGMERRAQAANEAAAAPAQGEGGADDGSAKEEQK